MSLLDSLWSWDFTWFTTTLSFGGMGLLARHNRAGWLIGVVRDVIWFGIALHQGWYGLVVGSIFGIGTNIYGYWRWR